MKKDEYIPGIKCPYCGYENKKHNVKIYGTCTGCRNTLDEKAKFKYEMSKRLRLWRYKSNK